MQTAGNRARTLLTRKFPDEYRTLYLQLKKQFPDSSRSRIQDRTKMKLVELFGKEYKELYNRAVGQGYPRSTARKNPRVRSSSRREDS